MTNIAMSTGHRCKSPGKAHCQLNYSLQEQVVDVCVQGKVKQARQQVLDSIDVMGIRGPQWINSSLVIDNKRSTAASDERLANQLLCSSFASADLRATRTSTQVFDKQRYHAFTRGEATTGWNLSTQVTHQEKRQWQQQQLDKEAKHARVGKTQPLQHYIAPSQREAAFAASMRARKEAAAAEQVRLVTQYGVEGAAAMQQILAMKAPDRPVIQTKATKEDRREVQQLPPLGLAEP